MAWLKKVDHVTYAVSRMREWAWFHIVVEGGRLVTRIDDLMPENPHSSMRLWCISYGRFGIALVQGIDRKEDSQVTAFVRIHGDHSVQHVAYEAEDLDGFRERLAQFHAHARGEVLVRHDGFGIVKQIFLKGYADADDPAMMSFPEYVERPALRGKKPDVTFSQKAGRGFYAQIERERTRHDHQTLLDFSAIPSNWDPVLRPVSPRGKRPAKGRGKGGHPSQAAPVSQGRREPV